MRAVAQRKLLAVDYPQVHMPILLIATVVVLDLVAKAAFAQSSAILSVTARVIAACTITNAQRRASAKNRNAGKSNVSELLGKDGQSLGHCKAILIIGRCAGLLSGRRQELRILSNPFFEELACGR